MSERFVAHAAGREAAAVVKDGHRPHPLAFEDAEPRVPRGVRRVAVYLVEELAVVCDREHEHCRGVPKPAGRERAVVQATELEFVELAARQLQEADLELLRRHEELHAHDLGGVRSGADQDIAGNESGWTSGIDCTCALPAEGRMRRMKTARY